MIDTYIQNSVPNSTKNLSGNLAKRDSKSKVSIVIPGNNEEMYVARTLQSIVDMECDPMFYEVIVVDNNSTDRTREVSKDFSSAHPGHALYLIQEPIRGIQYARKLGCDLAVLRGAPIIAQTDADMVIASDWLPQILKAFDDPTLDALRGYLEVNLQETNERILAITDYHGIGDVKRFAEELGSHMVEMTKLFEEYRNVTKDPALQETPGMLSGNNAFRTIAYCAVGGYDLGITVNENKVLGEKMRAQGFKILYSQDVKAKLSLRRHFRYDGRTLFMSDLDEMYASREFCPNGIKKMIMEDFRAVWQQEQKEAGEKIKAYKS